ncbi:MAG TPA: hypothetical protein VJ992_13480 [Gemmatimonadales bacterium]|nr:hypothetical protein [Gemmatimonadales bacterium]
MNSKNVPDRPLYVAGWGHATFAATLVVLGIVGLITGDFTAIWTPVPAHVPAREVLAYFSGLVALGTGAALFWRRGAAVASGVLLGVLLAWLLVLDVPALFLDPGMAVMWPACKTATLVAAAGVLYVRFVGGDAEGRQAFAGRRIGLRITRALYGLALIPFGIAHFTYLTRTVSMVPGWLPWHLAWAYFFGCTFIAAGIAVLIRVYARLAAVLVVVQLAMFTVLVWVPVVSSHPRASDWTEFVTSWALTAAAWVIADSYRDIPWLAVGAG